ncbi:MAG TPA: hypothetical protein DC013_01680 [Ruminococcaceae bacterium]|jgi:ethanolamine utilization protein EutN|nr:hypothetical protein [Oscillospiraceae bacterium]
MMIAKVVGNVVTTKKHAALCGEKLLVVRAVGRDGRGHGEKLLAFDRADAGIGDTVVAVTEGGAAKQLVHAEKNSPVDLCIAGVLDRTG